MEPGKGHDEGARLARHVAAVMAGINRAAEEHEYVDERMLCGIEHGLVIADLLALNEFDLPHKALAHILQTRRGYWQQVIKAAEDMLVAKGIVAPGRGPLPPN